MDKTDIRTQLAMILSTRGAGDLMESLSGGLWGATSERATADSIRQLVEAQTESKDSPSYAGKSAEALTAEMTQLGRAMAEVKAASLQQTATVEQNTMALAEGTASRLRDVAGTVSSVIGGGSGWLNLAGGLGAAVSGISKLFSQDKKEPAVEVIPYVQPAPVRIEAALPQGDLSGFSNVAYGQDGLVRSLPSPTAVSPQITVQVQTMDSRSFLDHSDDIARAVRNAMLNMHSVNDVMAEL